MKPVDPDNILLTCPCGWSRRLRSHDNREEALRYHRIQVHNDVELTRLGRF